MDILDLFEKVALILGGGIFAKLIEMWQSNKHDKHELDGKRTVDATAITSMLITQNQEMYNNLIREVERLKTELDSIQKQAEELIKMQFTLEQENMRLRFLLDLSPTDPIPKKQDVKVEYINQSSSSDLI